MPVFVVVLRKEIEKVTERIEAFPEDSTFKLNDNTWLVSFTGTTRGLAEKLGFRDEAPAWIEGASGIAFPISNYSGRWPTEVWEWLGIHMTRGDV
jgi:hypothetical protein